MSEVEAQHRYRMKGTVTVQRTMTYMAKINPYVDKLLFITKELRGIFTVLNNQGEP